MLDVVMSQNTRALNCSRIMQEIDSKVSHLKKSVCSVLILSLTPIYVYHTSSFRNTFGLDTCRSDGTVVVRTSDQIFNLFHGN